MGGNFEITELVNHDDLNYDREKDLNELNSTKSGVKGLVDSGICNVPRIFKVPEETKYSEQLNSDGNAAESQVPVISLEGYQGKRRQIIIDEVLAASKTWGIFQVVSHGVPAVVMKNMLESVAGFHEQPKELKEEFYSHYPKRKVWYYLTVHPVLRAAFWKDTIACQFEDIASDFQALPLICRKPMTDYVTHVSNLKEELSKILAEALGLESDHLEQMECMEPRKVVGHYYPSCPEPELTMGTPKHSDPYFLTILLQDNVNGLQVLRQNQWVNVKPVDGALIVIIGDMLQLVTNNMVTSAEHRVLATRRGPRLSAACFFYPTTINQDQTFGPIKELVSDDNPALYTEITHAEYLKHYRIQGSCVSKALPNLRL